MNLEKPNGGCRDAAPFYQSVHREDSGSISLGLGGFEAPSTPLRLVSPKWGTNKLSDQFSPSAR